MTPLIERNTTIPTRKSQVFSTAEDGQTAVDVHVLQGERPMVADNMSLGSFRLDSIPPAPRGTPQVEVTFDIDANGILNVSARDQASGREQRVTITASTQLNTAEVERMVREAQTNAAEDQRRRELAEARNLADNVLYQAEKVLGAEGVPEAQRAELQNRVNELRQVTSGGDLGRIRQLSEGLQQALQNQQPSAAAAQPAPGDGEPEVVDGEFRDA